MIPTEIKNCKPFTNSVSEIISSDHQPALFLTQLGISPDVCVADSVGYLIIAPMPHKRHSNS